MAFFPEVDVLLAVFNGAKYLPEFLNSLIGQKDVDINLLVSDDGSTDGSLRIISTYSGRFKSLNILEGPRIGPARNFFFLMQHSKSDYVALADQDDIWEPNHLKNSITRLKDSSSAISMTFSSTLVFRQGQKKQHIWPQYNSVPNLQSLLVENCARGCTMVMTKETISLLISNIPKFTIMHDWWALLVARTCGEVIYESSPEVRYRIHEDNAVGLGTNWIQRITKIGQGLRKLQWQPQQQAEELIAIHGASMHSEDFLTVRGFLLNLRGNWAVRFKKLALSRKRYRDKPLDELALRMVFVFFPLIFSSTTKL